MLRELASGKYSLAGQAFDCNAIFRLVQAVVSIIDTPDCDLTTFSLCCGCSRADRKT
jgi:hypothetical protein